MTIKKCAICGVEQKQFQDEKGAKTKKERIRRCNKCKRYVCAFCIQEVEIFTFNVSDLKLMEEESFLYAPPVTKRVCLECLEGEGI
jgi:hypothetical protein